MSITSSAPVWVRLIRRTVASLSFLKPRVTASCWSRGSVLSTSTWPISAKPALSETTLAPSAPWADWRPLVMPSLTPPRRFLPVSMAEDTRPWPHP
ncbi:hypothetical protein Y880_0204506 [Pseudomonas aeruginosa PAK]|nr:hypothetical protein Y880_0204506 [Pseudomonas aeruginosa PAK]